MSNGFTLISMLYCRKLLTNAREIAVKKRYGHFSYSEDPGGVLGAMTQAMLLGTEIKELDEITKSAIKLQQLYMNTAKVCCKENGCLSHKIIRDWCQIRFTISASS